MTEDFNKTMKIPKIRITLTILVVALFISFNALYDKFQGPIEGQSATLQLSDDPVVYTVGKEAAEGQLKEYGHIIVVFFLSGIWVTYFFKVIRKPKTTNN